MATISLHPLIRHLRRLAGDRPTPDLPDAALLARFAADRDEAAFDELVRRHGPLVLGVCRRVLGDWHAAEDAFQEVFVLLARKGAALRRPEGVGPWLFGVAHRAARAAKVRAARRGACERKTAASPTVEPSDDLVWRDLRPVLDDAVARLPEKHRTPFVLHYLQGVSVDEVAGRLGWPRGTVATRLARARAQLRKGLARRGVSLSAALTAGLSARAAAGAVPPQLVTDAVRAALARGINLTESAAPGAACDKGGLNFMLTLKGKSLTAVLLIAVLAVGGASLLMPGARADKPARGAAPADQAPPAADERRPAAVPARQAVGGAKPSVVEKQYRQYWVEIQLARADAGGRDLGPHGKAKVIAEPRLVTLEGQEGTCQAGGEVEVPGDESGRVESLPFGLTVRVKVKRLGDGRLRLDAALEWSEVEKKGQSGWRRRRAVVEAAERVKLGEAVKLVDKDGNGRTRFWALLRVTREESIQSRTESRVAPPETGTGRPAYVLGPPDLIQVESAEGLLTRPLRGPILVRPDGTVGLGTYGSVAVAGLTIEQARTAIAKAIYGRPGARGKKFPEVVEGLSVDVVAYNSQVYYVITDVLGEGEQVHRLPVTGSETVLDAVAQIKGLAAVAARSRLWVARRTGRPGEAPQVLPVDWAALTRGGAAATNYRLLPGDRLYVKADGQ